MALRHAALGPRTTLALAEATDGMYGRLLAPLVVIAAEESTTAAEFKDNLAAHAGGVRTALDALDEALAGIGGEG